MILYAKTEEEIQPDNRFMIHGNRISVKTLDLNRPLKTFKRHIITYHRQK